MGDRGRKECVEDSETSWGVEPNDKAHRRQWSTEELPSDVPTC